MKKTFFLLLAAACCLSTEAKVKMASLYGDGMVLQQNQTVRLCGWATPKAKVTVTTSWGTKKLQTTAASDGRWEIGVATPDATFDPQTVTVSDGETLVLNDVLIGEVWLASGQSNMEMPLVGFPSCPIEGYNEAILDCSRYQGKLHFVTVDRQAPEQPCDTVGGQWHDCLPTTANNFCAVGYFFGTALVDALDCPVGIINSSWGGTIVEAWLPNDKADNYSDFEEYKDAQRHIYNGMIRPIQHYAVKGFLWYQGESNVGRYKTYAAHFKDLITQWRADWGLGDLPFYYVEIAPFNYNTGNKAAMLREAQAQVQHEVPNARMVCTNDLAKPYEWNQIHPCMKREIGQRLSYIALTRDYGFKGLISESPEFQEMTVKDDRAYLSFSNVERGFNRFGDFEGFEICGPDRVFHKANVAITGTKLIVTSPEVKEPVAVRYCFKDFEFGNVKNVGGLPIVPFRTDKESEQ